ncbi:MAG: PKD domain-containing protein, partial [Promethearchaeota archaeon]
MIKILNSSKNDNEIYKVSKINRSTQIIAITLIIVFIIADISKIGFGNEVEVDLGASPTTVDVGENINFNWTSSGNIDHGQISFGDGNVTSFTSSGGNSSIVHKYELEGRYNVSILIWTSENDPSPSSDSLMVNIKNNPPQFNISIPSYANEDDAVNISVVDLVESTHDSQDNILTYIYDFADGNQTSSNQSSIIHKWENAGTYSVIVTVIDDQGALDRKSKDIEIYNVAPEADFSFAPESASNNTQSSYYGTYDFRGDIKGEEPSDWTVYDSDDIGVETATIRPNGDVQTGWGYPTPHYSRLDEDEASPDSTTIQCIQRIPWTESNPPTPYYYVTDIFNMDTINLNGGTITKVILHAYGKLIKEQTGAPGQPKSIINLGGWKEEKSWNFLINEYSWRSLTWDGLNASQTDLDNFQVEIEGNRYYPRTGNEIDTLYAEIHYQRNLEVVVVGEPGYYREVVKLYDYDTSEKVWIENSFTSQTGGTIEYYIKSNDTSQRDWIFSLYDSSTIGLKVFIEGNKWKFINGTVHHIAELGTPVINQWYRIQLDYCTLGSYLGLTAHQFRITVDNSTSNVYFFEDISQVNKIRFETNESTIGIIWIDAIGYSWDPDYTVGDNLYPVISYPEKTNVEFYANCLDTKSDIPSLRYFWDFGDGTSGWGKFVVHNFLSSGVYKVNLTCKDDNGLVDSYDRLVVIHNTYPDVLDITSSVDSIIINEGETVRFNATATDDEGDITRLSYYWDYEDYTFNQYNTSGYESGGWVTTHLYQDDYNGSSYILVKDSDNAFGYKAISVEVLNVDPLLSIWDAQILANISFEVFRKSTDYDTNFTFELLGNDDLRLTESLNFAGSSNLLEYTSITPIAMALSNMWKVKVNSTSILPQNSWFRYYIKLQFLDGQILLISSPKLYGGDYGEWEVDLNPYFFNNGDYTFMYPITFNAQIWDPSKDDISVLIQYNVSMQVVINCSDSLPIEDSFTKEHTVSNASYSINIYTEGNVKYANITGSQWIYSQVFLNNSFPISNDFTFTLYPIIDLLGLLQEEMDLTNLSIYNCIEASNFITGYVVDDDGGEGEITVVFDTEDNIEFENLSPYIESYFPTQAVQGTNITFYIDVSDFNQDENSIEYDIASFKGIDIPVMPDDFDITNGTCDWEGELLLQNDISATFTPDGSGDYPATYSFEADSSGTDPTDWVDTSDSYADGHVDDNYLSHKKILHLDDDYTYGRYRYRNDWPGGVQDYGTVEFWYCPQDASNGGIIYLQEFQVASMIRLYIQNDLWKYDPGSGWITIPNVPTPSDNTWQHVRIDFESTTGSYMELSQYKFEITIDGVQSGTLDFYSNQGDFDSLYFWSVMAPTTDNWVDAVGYSWDSNYTIGDNINDNSLLNYTVNLQVEELEENEILKYLKLVYAYNTDSSVNINLSLYNFKFKNWILIDSTEVNAQGYENRYSILNSEFLNDTSTILVRLEAANLNGKFYLDQFRLEYFSSKTSESGEFDREIIPKIPDDFSILCGSVNWTGDLETQDDNYISFSSANEESTHFAGTYSFENDAHGTTGTSIGFLDEYHGDDPQYEAYYDIRVLDGPYEGHGKVLHVRDSQGGANTWGVHNFDNPPSSGTIEFWLWMNDGSGGSANRRQYLQFRKSDNTIAFQARLRLMTAKLEYYNGSSWIEFADCDDEEWYHHSITFDCGTDNFTWIVSNSDGSQLAKIENIDFENGMTTLDEIYIGTTVSDYRGNSQWDAFGFTWEGYNKGDNFYPENNGLMVTSYFNLDGIRPEDQIETIDLSYALKTNKSQIIELSIYNHSSEDWVMLSSINEIEFANCSHSILNADYRDAYNDISIKIKGSNSTQFRLDLDSLKIKYRWLKASHSENEVYSSVPDQSIDFTISNGTLTSEGDLEQQDNNYTSFNSSSKLIAFKSHFNLEKVLPGDEIKSLILYYSYKTNITQLVNISLYNYTANDWVLIESSYHTAFSNESYSIPIQRFSLVNSSTVEYHDFFDSHFNILVKIQCENTSSNFQFYLDKFVIDYQFIPYSFRSDNWDDKIETVEDEYIVFESIDTEQYKSIYSFTNEADDTTGTDIDFVDYEYMEWDNNVKVISGLDCHQKVLELSVECEAQSIFEHHFDSGQENGTIEWFMRTNAANKQSYIDFTSGSGSGLLICIDEGKFKYSFYNWHNIRSASSNTWYHIRVDFECGSGGYKGLSADKFYIYIDGVQYGPYNFQNGKSSIEKIKFGSYITDYDYSSYFDDFGFSWDSNYTIGDNRFPTNYVSEEFEFSLEDLPYNFDTCELYHSIKTSSSQNVSLFLYNYTKSSWYKYNVISTDNSSYYNGTYIFSSADFLSYNNTVKVLVNVTTDSVGSFDLFLKSLELQYNWTRAHADFGIRSESIGLLIDYDMSTWNSTVFSNSYAYEEEGFYLVTVSACDGYFTTSIGKMIEIINSAPYNPFGIYSNASFEDTTLHFTANLGITDENSTLVDCKYFWNFGDGTYSNEKDPSHAYSDSGVYNVSLIVVDCFGNQFTDIKNITISEGVPKIVGPYTIHGIESQAIDLDVDIFDNFLDERKLGYEWFNSTASLVSTNKKPSIFLSSGAYQYVLNVTDELDNTATANISVIVEDTPPVIFVSNYMYSGGSVSESEGFFTGSVDGPGELELKAYGYDLGNDNDLDYYWSITSGNTSYNAIEVNAGTSSTKKFRVSETAVYLGQVKVVSSNMSAVANFMINSFIDSNGNGISDEIEELILEFYDNVTSYSDADNDALTDVYELTYNNSDYLDPDSDDDGLWDGLNNETGIGEQSLSTKPNDPDCDDDLLSDGAEFFGWNITTDFYGQIVVNSDPWDNDTDDDGLSDYEEYTLGTHPRSPDSDNDGLEDSIDPYPTKYDYDGDGLSDKIELDLGTALNISDTDNDGFSDAEEQLGWFKTNPLSADSDHDFASDTSEMQNYKASIDDRYDMNEPVSISFEVNCEKASSAQIAFMITFGEAINEPQNDKVYGIQDVPELNVTIYKVDDNLLLFNLTSSEFNQTSDDNSTRYLSRVVDIRDTIENRSLDYRGVYMIKINNTEAGCMLEQFDIEIAGYLDPWDSDFDDDGIMDGVEMGLLVPGVATINSRDIYGENITIQFPMEETCWWTLDDGSGITATDLSAYENDGVLTNMELGDWKSGKIGDYALEFDGIDEFIDCGNEYYLDFERNNTFTLSTWIKTTSVDCSILSKMNVSDNYRGYDLYCNENGKIRAHLISTINSNELIVDSSATINDNQWHFIVMTYDSSSNATGVKLYIDGALDNLTTIANTLNQT